MHPLPLLILVSASAVSAFPWIADLPGYDPTFLRKHAREQPQRRQDASCPFNADHTGAAPYDPAFPYTGAQNGLPGTGIGGIKVPADGDTAHQYTAPTANDIRGPCPGMNTAANHNFLSHDGIVTYAELLDAQQNLYNLDYALANVIAARAVTLDGDLVTLKMSIGCDATSRTAALGSTVSTEPGLNGHNKFEADTSLTRDDYFLGNGDNFSFNGTLFAEMTAVADETSGGLYDRDAIALYRSNRYDESLNTNPNFYFGPKALLLYGAASFVYEVMPVLGPEGTPDLATISTFFGAVSDGAGGYNHVPERIPDNWSNRATAYGLLEIGEEIRYQYSKYPKLFGGNAGVGNFDSLGAFGIIQNGTIPSDATVADYLCLLYQAGVENVPGTVDNEAELPLTAIQFLLSVYNPIFAQYGCPLVVV